MPADGELSARMPDPLECPEQVLGADLWTLVNEREAPLADFAILTTKPSPRQNHASFRLLFADGQVLKGRRVENEEAAQRLLDIRRQIDSPYLAEIIAAHGSAFLERWVNGSCLANLKPSADQLRRCGAVLGRLHASMDVRNEVSLRRRKAIEWREITLLKIDELQEYVAISDNTLRKLHNLVNTFAPDECTRGLTHNDFCADNIVVADGDDPVVVDNETLAVNPLAYDLARVWYRWRMNKAERQFFLEGYGAQGVLREFEGGFPFWAVGAVVTGALFRLRNDVAGESHALRMLNTLSGSKWTGLLNACRQPLLENRRYASFRFGDFSVGATVSAPADLDWLREFLTPQFEAAADISPNYDVSAIGDGDAVDFADQTIPPRTEAELACFVRDGGAIQAARWVDQDRDRIVYDQQMRVVYRVARDGSRIRLYYDPRKGRWRIGLMRVIRELIMRECCRSDYPLVHAAAFEHAGNGILIVGPKQAGKTTLLTHVLRNSATRYVSNDRVALVRKDDGEIQIRGIPTIVSIRPDTTKLLPWIRDRQRTCTFRQWLTIEESSLQPVVAETYQQVIESPNLTPGQYCAVVGTDSVPAAPLSAILFPNRREDEASAGPGFELRRLDPHDAARRLYQSIFGPPGLMPGGGLLNDESAARSRSKLSQADMLGLTSSVACFECSLHTEFYTRGDSASLLDSIS